MSNLLNDLAQIREMQGRDPLPDPRFIQGFEPGSPPVPEHRPVSLNPPLPPGIEDEFLDGGPPPEESTVPASPLIPRRAAGIPEIAPGHRLVNPPSMPPLFSLVVADRQAGWKGRDVVLTEDEEKRVRAVVLGALQRELDADLSAVAPRRRNRAPATPKPAGEAPATLQAPRRRGRPRKEKP